MAAPYCRQPADIFTAQSLQRFFAILEGFGFISSTKVVRFCVCGILPVYNVFNLSVTSCDVALLSSGYCGHFPPMVQGRNRGWKRADIWIFWDFLKLIEVFLNFRAFWGVFFGAKSEGM